MITPQTVLNSRYRLDKQIGEGGFARVFLATDLQLGRQVAVKVLSSNMAENEEFLGRFKQEARSIAGFEHPNILSIYDYGEFEGSPYLVMPYIDGGTLHDRLKRGPISIEEAGKMLDQMGAALDYAHDRNTVHRDVKPQNMLMRSDGRLMLTDFGIAKLLTDENSNSQTRSMGTVSYMAPEQSDGHVTRQSDIYSMGVVLFQMLTGQLPFTGTTSQVLTGHFTRPVPSLVGQTSLLNASPVTLRKIDETIQKAMSKNPADRYHTVGEFAKAYNAALATPVNEDPTMVARPGMSDAGAPTIFANPTPPQAYTPAPPSYSQPQVGYNNTPAPQGYTQPPAGYTQQTPYGYTPNPQSTQPGFGGTNQYAAPTTQPQVQGGQPPYGPGQYGNQYGGMPPQGQPPKKSNMALFAILGGVGALVVVGIILAVVLGGSKPAPVTPTAVAVSTATTAPATTAAVATTAAPATTAATTAATTTQAVATTAAATTAVATTAAPVTTQAVATTARPTTAAPATTARPTTAPATTVAAAATIKAPDGYGVFRNTNTKELNLEIAYPTKWTTKLDPDNLGVTISDGAGTSYIILREDTAGTSGTIDELNARFINDLKKEGWKPYATGARFFGIAGEKWVQSSYIKGDFRAWGLFALHRGVPYAILLTGNDKGFDKILGEEFTRMFEKMHFLDSPISLFANELMSYNDPDNRFHINYPVDTFKLDKDIVLKKDKDSTGFYMYDVSNSSLSISDNLTNYKDKLANAGDYENFKETKTYSVTNFDSNTQEQVLAFSFTYKGNSYIGEIYIRKQGNRVYAGVSEADNQDDLDTIYSKVWRYVEFIK